MYLNDHEVVFCTLAIGERYRHMVNTQIQSVLKFTSHDIYVMTDDIKSFGNYYPKRVHFVPFASTMPIMGKQNMFNYNLKLEPLEYVFENIKPGMAIWMDCDSFLFGWTRTFFNRFDPHKYGIWGRFRHAVNDPCSHQLIVEKFAQMQVDVSKITTQLPIENVMFWKNGARIKVLLEAWRKYAQISVANGCRTDFECCELALAIHDSCTPYVNIQSDNSYNIEDFRTLHLNSIHIPFVI